MCVCVSFPGIAIALKRQLCFDWPEVMGTSGSLGRVFFSGFESIPAFCISDASSSHLSSSTCGLSRWLHHFLHLFTTSSHGRWLGRHERKEESVEKEDKPSALPFLQSLLAWLASQPPTGPPFGNGVLTILFEVYHSLVQNSLLILAFPLVGSPYVRGIHGCCSPAKSCLTLGPREL